MAKNSNYSILLDAEFDTKQIQQELDKVRIPADQFTKLSQGLKEARQNTDEFALSVDAANKVFQMAKDTISSFVEQVYELDNSLTEFKKVSDLSGSSLDNYVSKLSKMGQSVARTGKPNRSEPGQWDGKPVSRIAPKPLKASRALSLQHKDEICLSVNVRNH